MPTIIRATPPKNLTSTSDSFFINLWVINVTMNVTQLTEGTAIDRSFPATTKLFKRDASWFRPKGRRKRQFAKRLPKSPKSFPKKL